MNDPGAYGASVSSESKRTHGFRLDATRGRECLATNLDMAERYRALLSTRSVEAPRNKNIPMVWEKDQLHTRPVEDNVSPLMMLRDQYNTKRPNTGSQIDRRSESLCGPKSSRASSRHMPLATLSKNEDSSISLKFHSELDDDSIDEYTQKAEPWESGDNFMDNNFLNSLLANKQNMKDMLAEIDDFQSKFVQRFSACEPTVSDSSILPVSRVQQKALDYRDLMSSEKDDINSSQSYLSLSSINSETSTSFAYTVKKQHEMITSQYTLIRFRFASLPGRFGALGHLARTPDPQIPVEQKFTITNQQQAQSFIQSVWDEELQSLVSRKP